MTLLPSTVIIAILLVISWHVFGIYLILKRYDKAIVKEKEEQEAKRKKYRGGQ